MKRFTFIIALLVVGLIAYACGGGSTSVTPGTEDFSGVAPLSSDAGRGVASADEVIYVANGAWGNVPVGLYTLTINDTDTSATGTQVEGFDASWLGHIAAPPAGDKVYVHGNGQGVTGPNDGFFGIYDVASESYTPIKDGYADGVTMAACDNEGNFFVGNQLNSHLYLVDTTTGDYTDLGFIYAGPGKTNKISLSGGDIAFDAAGAFYMITNANKGLYLVTEETDGVDTWYEGEALWTSMPYTVSGLALRDNGEGDLLATMQSGGGLLVIDRDNNYAPTVYNWTGGYSHHQGDMSVGLFGYPEPPYETETAWGEGEDFGKGWAMIFTLNDSPVTLWAGQNMDAGAVTAEIVGDDLVVTYDVDGWSLIDSHLYVGMSIPNKSAPGKFPYHHDDSVDGVYTVPLADIEDYDSDGTLYIAAHAVVRHYVGY